MVARHILVSLHPYRRVLQFKIAHDDLERAIRALYSDVIQSDEKILIQVEEKWGDRQYFIDVQDRSIPENSVLQVLRLHQVRACCTQRKCPSLSLYIHMYRKSAMMVLARVWW